MTVKFEKVHKRWSTTIRERRKPTPSVESEAP